MFKIIIIAIVISAVIGTFFVAVPRIASAVTQTENQTNSFNSEDFVEDYRGTIASVITNAADDLQDQELAAFYGKLVQEYDLDQATLEETGTDISLEDALPDIKRIHAAAMTLPLQEAGKAIQDEDLADFYSSFLKNAGWEVEPD